MKKMLLLLLTLILIINCKEKTEPHVSSIVQRLESIISSVKTSKDCQNQKCLTLAFWDFDGTLLKGDCSEGLQESGKQIFSGIIEAGIDAGLSPKYKRGSYRDFNNDYHAIKKSKGHIEAYRYILSIFEGVSADIINALAEKKFHEMWPYTFKSSQIIFSKLKELGVENYVLSASSDIFVDEADSFLSIPRDHLHGILAKIKEGRLTSQLIEPTTYAEGKAAKIRQIVQRRSKDYDRIFIIAAFGNSYGTDGPFLKYVSKQKLPAEQSAVVMMINGGEAPPQYAGLFTKVNQSQVIGR